MFRGKPIVLDQPVRVETFYIKHFYNRLPYKNDIPRHACLITGFWCWSNAFTHPKDILYYLRVKFKKE